MTATEIPMGGRATIQRLMMDGAEKRRLMDLGFCPGALIEHVLEAPFGETPAFMIRGTVIALRSEQSDQIEVLPCTS